MNTKTYLIIGGGATTFMFLKHGNVPAAAFSGFCYAFAYFSLLDSDRKHDTIMNEKNK